MGVEETESARETDKLGDDAVGEYKVKSEDGSGSIG